MRYANCLAQHLVALGRSVIAPLRENIKSCYKRAGEDPSAFSPLQFCRHCISTRKSLRSHTEELEAVRGCCASANKKCLVKTDLPTGWLLHTKDSEENLALVKRSH